MSNPLPPMPVPESSSPAKLRADYIIPSVFDKELPKRSHARVEEAAYWTDEVTVHTLMRLDD